MEETNFDRFLAEKLKDTEFAAAFQKASLRCDELLREAAEAKAAKRAARRKRRTRPKEE